MKTNLSVKNWFLFLAFGTISIAGFTSCKDDDPSPVPATNTIKDKVVADASFSILEKAVVKAGLDATLASTGPFTVFAPDDAAFTASGITSATIDALSSDDLKKILLYHVLASKVMAADVPAGPNAKVLTANTPQDSIFVTKNSAGVFINGIQVTAADVAADNGVIHKIGRVLMPPSGNVVETAIATSGGDNGLDSLVAAVVRADAAAPGLINTLGSVNLTVFAPTNKAFRDLLTALSANKIADIPINTLIAVLQYHVVPGRVFSSDLSNGNVTMLAGGNTTINLTNGTGGGPTVTGNGNAGASSNIIATNVMATNGVVHVIDRVLLP